MPFLMNYDLNPNLEGVNGYGRQPANYNGNTIGIYNTLVASATDTTLTVPNAIGAGRLTNNIPEVLAIFSAPASANVFIAVQTATNGVTTALPNATGTFTANAAILNPTAFLLRGGDILHFYSIGGTAYISVEFYSVT